jgi:hypothetical protein
MKRGKPLQSKTPMRRVSAKEKARKATEKAQGAWEHMAAVKMLPCIACGAAPPSQAHHVTGDKKPRSDWRVIPLCYACHQGPLGYHAAKRSWVEQYGPDYEFLPLVADLLQRH